MSYTSIQYRSKKFPVRLMLHRETKKSARRPLFLWRKCRKKAYYGLLETLIMSCRTIEADDLELGGIVAVFETNDSDRHCAIPLGYPARVVAMQLPFVQIR
jgi:hypothetical protein